MRRVLNCLHCDGLKPGELAEDVKELTDAKVLLHLRLTYELDVAKLELFDSASEVLSVCCHAFVCEYSLSACCLHSF